MRMPHVFLLASLIWSMAIAGATDEVEPPPVSEISQHSPPPAPGKIAGKVKQTMDVSQYTYMEVDTGEGLIWIAGPVTKVKVGDTVEVPSGIQMVDFKSNTLKRTFDEIRLVSAIQVTSPQQDGSVAAAADGSAGAEIQISGIERVEGGHTVGEVIAGKESLAGSEVAVRGKVIKMNAAIMGRNWLHLSDGTVGPGGEQEVTVSTEDIAAVGSIVVVRGILATDREFGSGYNYSVLIEDAKVTID